MRVLLDTHILLWWFYERERLSDTALETVRDADEVFISSASIWEIAIKVRLGKIRAKPKELVEQLHQYDFVPLPVSMKHAIAVADLPMHHTDPFDRLLVAQAIVEPMRLLTIDLKLHRYTDLIIRA
jgi:PIN domain nuclease of toxin-antitoxin system